MLIVGAKGHAKEILDVLEKNVTSDKLFFYDDYSIVKPAKFFNKYPILKTMNEARELFQIDPRFILGVGNPNIRFGLSQRMIANKGQLTSLISNTAIIGNYNVKLEKGINIMHSVIISNDVSIGEGTLLNSNATIHHDSIIGKYCEISPGCNLTGAIEVGDFTFIGAGVVIIPKIKIGKNCIIGAGSVINKDIPDNSVAVGVPAKVIKQNEPSNR